MSRKEMLVGRPRSTRVQLSGSLRSYVVFIFMIVILSSRCRGRGLTLPKTHIWRFSRRLSTISEEALILLLLMSILHLSLNEDGSICLLPSGVCVSTSTE